MPTQSETPALPTARPAGCPFDPPAEYAALRETAPVARARCPAGFDTWLVTRYDDVRAVLADPALSSRGASSVHVKAGLDPYAEVDPGSIIQLDGAEHARLRKMVVAEFTVRRVERLREYVREQVDRHLDAMLAKPGPADLVRDFALPIPSLVICELLGVPSAGRELFQRQSSLLVSTDQSPDATRKAYHELAGYLGTLFAGKQRDPRDDLFSRLIVRAEYSGEPLDLDELIMLGLSLLVAGHETTANMIALSTLLTPLLLEHPEQRAQALADPPRVTG